MKPNILFLMETKLPEDRALFLYFQFGILHGLVVGRRGLGGGLALYWREDIDLSIVHYSQGHISVSLLQIRSWVRWAFCLIFMAIRRPTFARNHGIC